MRIAIRTDRDLLTGDMRQQLERQLYIALHAFNRYIDEVVFTLRDVNGPRGGRDKQGQVVVHLRRGTPLVVRAMAENALTLGAQLAAATRRAVKSRIRRRRTLAIRHLRRRLRNGLSAAWSSSAHSHESQAA
jgi:hypothetical protein